MAASSPATRAAREVQFLKSRQIDNRKPSLFHDGVDVGAALSLAGEADLRRTEDVNERARHSPETQPNEASRRGPNDKKKGEQPSINVAAASDDAHETIKWSEIIQASTNSSLNSLFGHAFQPFEGKESGENYV